MAADRRFMLGPDSWTCGRKCGCRQKVYVRPILIDRKCGCRQKVYVRPRLMDLWESVAADRRFMLGPDSWTCGRKCGCRQKVYVRPILIDLWEKVWLQTEGLC